MLRQECWKAWTLAAVMAVLAAGPGWSQDRGGSLQGVVKNASGQPVAGAFVKMQNAARGLTFMVISQAQGRYSMKNLPAGQYVVQGVGGDYQSPRAAAVDVQAGQPATVDVSLTEQRPPQLPPAWPGRTPGQGGGEAERATEPLNLPDGEGKRILSTKCAMCHDAARTANARKTRDAWQDTIAEMRLYAQGSNYAKDLTDQEEKVLLDYVSEHFSGGRNRGMRKVDPNSRLPRKLMTGEAMKYVAVEFQGPDTSAEFHEVTVDPEGNGWVTQRGGGKLGRLDLKTLTYTEIDPPPGTSNRVRLNAINSAPDGKIWFLDGGPNRRWLTIDPRSREFNVFTLPKLRSGAASGNTMRVHPNGTIWQNSIAANQVIRLDPKTKEFAVFEVPSGVKAGRTANPYGLAFDGAGKVWIVENAMDKVARIDPVTGKFEEFDIPVKDPVARKAGTASNGDVYVSLHGAGKLMKIDYKTAKMTVYSPPTENSGVYSPQGHPNTPYVWFSQQHVDQIARFDPRTETFVEFPLATAEEDHRRIEIDPNNPNRIWWSGNLSARIGYIELLDAN